MAGNWATIAGAIGVGRTPDAADRGKRLRITGVGTKGAQSVSFTSSATDAVVLPLSLTGTPSPDGFKTVAYTFTPGVVGGTTGLLFALETGTLPAGLSLNTSTGAITGTPTTLQTTGALLLRATDLYGQVAYVPSWAITVYETILNYDFRTATTAAAAGFTVTRAASTGSYIPNNANPPALVRHDGTVNTARQSNAGLFIEGTGKSGARSNDLVNGTSGSPVVSWPLTGGGSRTSGATDPAGGADAWTLDFGSTGSDQAHFLENYYWLQNDQQGSGNSVYSFFLKPGLTNPMNEFVLKIGNIGTGFETFAKFNLSTGVVTQSVAQNNIANQDPIGGLSNARAEIVSYANGWKRISLSLNMVYNSALSALHIGALDPVGDLTTTWNAATYPNRKTIAWLPQLQIMERHPGSPWEHYDDVSGVFINRPADVIERTYSERPANYEVRLGVLPVEQIGILGDANFTPPTRTIAHLYTGADDNNGIFAEIGANGKIKVRAVIAGITYNLGTATTVADLTTTNVVRIACSGSRYGAFVNDVFIGSKDIPAAARVGWTKVKLGMTRAGTNPLRGHFQTISVLDGAPDLTSGALGNGLVQPHPGWNGTPLEGVGGVAPSDLTIARTTAKPAAHWHQPGEEVITGTTWIGVDAQAKGGIEYVEFYGDCDTTRVTTPTIRSYTTKRGLTRLSWGYWVQLDGAAFTAVSSTGSMRVFAKVKANDATMQVRIIGNGLRLDDGVNVVGWQDWEQKYYPRTTMADFDKTVGAGGDYSTIKLAIDAARALTNVSFIRLKLLDTAPTPGIPNYPLEDITGYTGADNRKGRLVIWCDTDKRPCVGVTTARDPEVHVIGRVWKCGWGNGVEFQGPIDIDQRNWNTIEFMQNPSNIGPCGGIFINGARMLGDPEFVGMRPKCNWSGAPVPPFGSQYTNQNVRREPNHFLDCIVVRQAPPWTYDGLVSGVKANYTGGTMWYGNSFVVDSEFQDATVETVRLYGIGRTTMTITGPAGYKIDYLCQGEHGTLTENGSLIFKDGSGTQVGTTIVLARRPSQGPVSTADLVAAFTSHAAYTAGCRIVAVAEAANFLAPRYGAPWTLTNQAIDGGQPYKFKTWLDIHTEITFEGHTNVIYRNCIVPHGFWSTGLIFGGHHKDTFFINQLYDCTPNSSPQTLLEDAPGERLVFPGDPTRLPYESIGGGNGAWGQGSHLCIWNSYLDGFVGHGTGAWDAYSDTYGMVGDFFSYEGTGVSTIMRGSLINTKTGGATFPYSASPTNVLLNNTSTYNSLWINKGQDFRPNPSGALFNNLIPPDRVPYDLYYRTRPTTGGGDVPGAIAKNQAAVALFNCFEGL